MRVPTIAAWDVDGSLSYADLIELAEENKKVHVIAKTLRDGAIINGTAKLHIQNCDVVFAIFDNGVWHALWPQERYTRTIKHHHAPVVPIRYRPPDTARLANQPSKKAAGWP